MGRKSGKTRERHAPLADSLTEEQFARPSKRVKFQEQENNNDEHVLPRDLREKVLSQSKLLEVEMEREEQEERGAGRNDNAMDSDGGSEVSDQEEDIDQIEEDLDLTEEDRVALEAGSGISIADLIMEQLHEKERSGREHMTSEEAVDGKITAVYEKVGQVMAKYRSGKVPKALKIIPIFKNWEDYLWMTNPERWSPNAVAVATRIFVSNLKDAAVHRYFNTILLPRVRLDIAEHKKLNFHLYQALRKALYKPAAFFRGILLPLCESGNCSLREAVILTSIIAKRSIPSMYSAVAILKIIELPYSGINCLFIRVLVDKKYALPLKVINDLAGFFLKMKTREERLPVVWHQAFLSFAQRYKHQLTNDQKRALMSLADDMTPGKVALLVPPSVVPKLFCIWQQAKVNI